MRKLGAPVAQARSALSNSCERESADEALAHPLSVGSEIVSNAARDLLMIFPAAAESVSVPRLTAALEASWVRGTAYLGAYRRGNPALGQCYPTARVVQWFFPSLDIVSGAVDTGAALECHFWNIDESSDPVTHIDLTWQQFPPDSVIREFRVLDRTALGDSPGTIARCQLLLYRVLMTLARQSGPF